MLVMSHNDCTWLGTRHTHQHRLLCQHSCWHATMHSAILRTGRHPPQKKQDWTLQTWSTRAWAKVHVNHGTVPALIQKSFKLLRSEQRRRVAGGRLIDFITQRRTC